MDEEGKRPEPDDYVRASDYDLPKQALNRAVFASRLRRNPAAGVSLAVCFLALAVITATANSPGMAGNHPAWRWALAALSGGAAAWVLHATFRRNDRPR